MKSAATLHVLGKARASILASVLAAGIMSVAPLYPQSDAAAELGKTKSIAEAQHEIVILLIKQKEFQKALTEANKIFEMNWPENQEPLLLKELVFISDQFLRHGQPAIGLQVIDGNAKYFKTSPSQIAIWKEKGYLYKNLDQSTKAIECFRKAQELEGKR